ncbi:MAG: hypothetical protein H0X72_10515 [Acidobacteria bacterium]|nr:hypothetical protein [Acidobacteriota bacterium]
MSAGIAATRRISPLGFTPVTSNATRRNRPMRNPPGVRFQISGNLDTICSTGTLKELINNESNDTKHIRVDNYRADGRDIFRQRQRTNRVFG